MQFRTCTHGIISENLSWNPQYKLITSDNISFVVLLQLLCSFNWLDLSEAQSLCRLGECGSLIRLKVILRMKISNNLLGLLNILIFLVSIPIVYFGIIANKTNSGGECLDLFRKPFLVVGVFVMVTSIFGIIGGCCRVPWILWTYLAIMFLVLLAYFSMWIFAFFVTWKPGGGTEILGTGHMEFKLNRYTEWMQMRVQDEKNWKKIKHCLILGDYCPSLMPGNGTSLRDFNKEELGPVLVSIYIQV